jgi:hypothetical protein
MDRCVICRDLYRVIHLGDHRSVSVLAECAFHFRRRLGRVCGYRSAQAFLHNFGLVGGVHAPSFAFSRIHHLPCIPGSTSCVFRGYIAAAQPLAVSMSRFQMTSILNSTAKLSPSALDELCLVGRSRISVGDRHKRRYKVASSRTSRAQPQDRVKPAPPCP